MDRYGKITETNRKENYNSVDEALDTTIPVDKCFKFIDDCIQYLYYDKQPYVAAQIINNAYNMVLYTGQKYVAQESRIWKTWAAFKDFFAEKYHDIHKHQNIDATQEVFHGGNMDIIMKNNIYEALDNLAVSKNLEKDVLAQITSTIKHLVNINKILR